MDDFHITRTGVKKAGSVCLQVFSLKWSTAECFGVSLRVLNRKKSMLVLFKNCCFLEKFRLRPHSRILVPWYLFKVSDEHPVLMGVFLGFMNPDLAYLIHSPLSTGYVWVCLLSGRSYLYHRCYQVTFPALIIFFMSLWFSLCVHRVTEASGSFIPQFPCNFYAINHVIFKPP